jgi:ACR3 family arsenite transporter
MESDPSPGKRLNVFEKYLTVWVALCMVAGVLLGKLLPGLVGATRSMEFGQDSQINMPIAVLIWLMIYPMMLKIDFASIVGVRRRPGGILVTLFVNWLVKPFSMAFLGWLFFKHLFLPIIGPELADQYVAGTIILAAAPCTAMVFVWSYLTDGDPAYTLVQVSLNDLIMLFLFAPIVGLLVAGASGLHLPFQVLLYSVVAFIVIPLALGSLSRVVLLRARGREWFEEVFLPFFHPVTVVALLATLVLIFAFQADNLTGRWFHVLLIAVPILIQVYFNSALAYGLMRFFRIPFNIAAPGALIGASNFFELAVAVAITLFGADSGAALATVVGVLVEVPVMLSVCAACNRTRHWFPGCNQPLDPLSDRQVRKGIEARVSPPSERSLPPGRPAWRRDDFRGNARSRYLRPTGPGVPSRLPGCWPGPRTPPSSAQGPTTASSHGSRRGRRSDRPHPEGVPATSSRPWMTSSIRRPERARRDRPSALTIPAVTVVWNP